MIRTWLHRITGVEREEILPVFLLVAYGFLVMASYYAVRPARNSIFVDRVGAENLSYVFILTALLVTAVVVVYSKYVDRIDPRALLLGTFAFVGGGLVLFWWLLLEYPLSVLVSAGFYIWVQLYILLLVSQFWLTGNLVFTTRQAKRLFGMVGVGLIVGAIAGSAISGFFTSVIGSEYLLLVAAGIIGLCAGICLLLFPHMTRGREVSGRLSEGIAGDAVRILFRNGHLRTIALIVFLMITVHKILDYQLNSAAEVFIGTEEGMTAFWGRFYLVMNLVALSVQALLTSAVLRTLGVGVALLALPGGVLLVTLAVVAAPVLLTVTLALGVELALRYSLDQSTRELLYLPVPTETKYKVKPLIDLAVYRGGTGFGGVLLLLFVNWLGFGFRGVAAVTLVLILGWLGVALWMRREYVSTLARSFRKRFASLEDAFTSLIDADVQPLLSGALAGGDSLQTAFALDLLNQAAPGDVREHVGEVSRLLDDETPEIRAKALSVLTKVPEEADADRIEAELDDPDPRVREAAVRALCAVEGKEREALLSRLLGSESSAVRVATLKYLGRREDEDGGIADLALQFLESRWEGGRSRSRETRVELALAAGALADAPDAARYVGALLDDPDPEVAATALEGAGRVGREELYPRMIRRLADPETRPAARQALVRQGERAVGLLLEHLRDESTSPALRREIPTVLGRIPHQDAVDGLLHFVSVPSGDATLDFRALKALNKLRRHDADEFRFDPEPVRMTLDRALEEAEEYRALRRGLADVGAPGGAVGLLERSLDEAWARRREVVFRCLALVRPPKEVYRVYLALPGGESVARSNAVEWLEHSLGRERFLELTPVLEPESGEETDWPQVGDEGAVWILWREPDEWLRRCAVWAAVELELPGLYRRLELLRQDPNPEFQDLADRCLARIAGRAARTGERPRDRGELDLVQKVLRLQTVDLLEDLEPSEIALVGRLADEVEVDSDISLIERGQPGGSMYVVLDGRVRIAGGEGERLEVGEGGYVGSWALVDPGPSPVAARTVTETRCLRVTGAGFERLLTRRPELVPSILRGLARRLKGLADAPSPVAAEAN